MSCNECSRLLKVFCPNCTNEIALSAAEYDGIVLEACGMVEDADESLECVSALMHLRYCMDQVEGWAEV